MRIVGQERVVQGCVATLVLLRALFGVQPQNKGDQTRERPLQGRHGVQEREPRWCAADDDAVVVLGCWCGRLEFTAEGLVQRGKFGARRGARHTSGVDMQQHLLPKFNIVRGAAVLIVVVVVTTIIILVVSAAPTTHGRYRDRVVIGDGNMLERTSSAIVICEYCMMVKITRRSR